MVDLADKKVLVTGAAGFIGSHIVDRCLAQGAKTVIGLDDLSGGVLGNINHLNSENRFDFVEADIANGPLVEDLVGKSDIVFNNAASKLVVSLKNPRIDVATNVVGTFNVLLAASNTPGTTVIHASTGSVLGSSQTPMDEEHEKRPATVYGVSKFAAEEYCRYFARTANLRVGVLRYFHVYGPRQRYDSESGVISIFLSRVLKGEAPMVFGSGEQVRCFTYVDDVVDANFLLLEKGDLNAGIYNIASPDRVTVLELAELVCETYGTGAVQPSFGPPRDGENLRPIPDTQKIESLGFAAKTAFPTGLQATHDWVLSELDDDMG